MTEDFNESCQKHIEFVGVRRITIDADSIKDAKAYAEKKWEF